MPPTRAWIYDKNNPSASGTAPGPVAPAPNLTHLSDATLQYPMVGGLPKWNWKGDVTLPASYGGIRNIHVVIPTLSTSPNKRVLTIPSTKFGTTDFPLAGLVLSYQTENQDRDTITWDYTAEFWVENEDGVWTASPPTIPVEVVGTDAPFGGGTAPIPPTIPAATASATAYNVPYGNLWNLGFKVHFAAPAGDYSVRVVKISPAARSLGGLPQQATIDTVQGSFTAGQICELSSDAVDAGQLVPETWTIRFIGINADNKAGPVTDITCVASPSAISAVTCSEVGPRTNIIPDDPSASTQRGLLTTVKFNVALSANEGGTTWPQQIRAWMRYDRGSGANVETILLGSFPVVGTGFSTTNDFLVPNVWVSIKNMATPGTLFKVIAAIWASDSMPPPAENPGVNTGSFMMAPPAITQPGSNSASVDFVEYPEIPGGFAWRFHTISVTAPFGSAEFKAIEFTVQKVRNTGDPNDPANAAPDAEGIERTFAGSGASQTPYLNIDVNYATGLVKVTLLTAWTMPPTKNLDGSTNVFRRFIIRIKNVRQDDSKTTVNCWQSGAGPSAEITYALDRMEIIPVAGKAGTITGGTLALSFSGPDTSVGIFYTASLMAVGGAQPYTFSISAGALPPGLTLTAGTGQISGTPTTAGSYSFTGKVTDNVGTFTTLPCTIVVTASGVQTGLTLTAVANAITYQNWANAIVPVFSGTITLPTGAANYSSMTSIWIYAVSPTPPGLMVNIQTLRNWGAATSVNFSGWDSSIVCTAVDQTGWSLVFQPTNADDVAIGPPITLTTAGGVPIVIKAQSSTSLGLISSVAIVESGPTPGSAVARYQSPPGGSTYTYVTVTVTYSATQNTIPVFSVWHSFNGGATKLWFSWVQGKVGTNIQTTVLNFFIPLGTNSYQVYVAPGTTNYNDPVPANIVTSNTITLSLGAPSPTPGGAPILSITNYTGAAATQSNIFMGANALANPWAEAIIKCATPGQIDTAPYYYELWIAWTDASGNLVSPGGVANYFGWIRAWEFPNDGSVGIFDDKINYPAFDYYLEFRVYGRTRNSVGGTPPFAGDTGATAMQWPGGATFFRLHVGLPPGQAGTITQTTNNNTNVGLSILSNPSFESSLPGQIMGPNNTNPGPGYMYPGWVVDCQSGTSIITIMGTGGHSGPNFARLQGASTVLKQGFSIAPGSPIYIQFYLQSNTPSGGTHQLDITLFYLNATLGLISQSTIGTGVGTYASWSLVSILIPASSIPAGANLGILAFKTHFAEPTLGTWDVDEVMVQQAIQQTNGGQIQSMGSGAQPVGPIQLSAVTTASSYYGLDHFNMVSTGNDLVAGNVALGQASLHISASGGVAGNTNGFFFDPTPGAGGNRLTVFHQGAGNAGANITFRDQAGVLHTVWDGIIIS